MNLSSASSRFSLPATLSRDLPASIVVFMVAIPLCLGIALASGVPAEAGIISGVVGGILVGLIGGAPLQVSGPAAGLAVVVFEIVREHGIASLGPIVLAAGLLQIAAGMLGFGAWFRAISPAVVQGMLAGIGVLIVVVQLHVLIDAAPLPTALESLIAIPGAFGDVLKLATPTGAWALMVGVLTILAMIGWEKLRPQRLKLLPGALVGVAAGTLVANLLALPIKHVKVPENVFAGVMTLPGLAEFGRLADLNVLLAVVVIAVIASAETMLSAAAVDKMHDGPRANYNRELSAQGVGNAVCGAFGALPMTGVIVRSSANVQAGAASRWSAILHGVWLLAFVAAMPSALELVPTAALAGILVVTGWRLIQLEHARGLFRRHGPLPAAVWAATLIVVVAVDLLTGVLVGLALALVEVLPHLKRRYLVVRSHEHGDGEVALKLAGSATFLQLPALERELAAVPEGTRVTIETKRLDYIDHTTRELITEWAGRRAEGSTVKIAGRKTPHERRLAAALSGVSG